VIMIIVLILAAVLGILGGLWLKRRQRRKQEARHRDTTLVAEEAAAALRDRHPNTPSMVQLPPNSRALDKEVMSGALGPAGMTGGSRSGKGKGKGRARDREVREISGGTVDGTRSAFDPDSPPRRSGSRLKRKSSSRRSRSRRDK
jgi:type II secretory pathway pseudopilin PulG